MADATEIAKEELMKRIGDANHGWSTRIESEVHDVQYDHEADMLYATFGEQVDSFSVPVEENTFLRIDPESYGIVGMDFLHFRQLFLSNNQEAKSLWDTVFHFLGQGDWRYLHYPLTGEMLALEPAIIHQSFHSLPAYIIKAIPELASA